LNIPSQALTGQLFSPVKQGIPRIKIPQRAEIVETCKRFKSVLPWIASEPERYGFIQANQDAQKWRKIKYQQRRKIVTASGLTASEKAILAAHLHFSPILIDGRGAWFWGPSAVALSMLAKATGKSERTVKRVRAGLVQRNLLAPVGRRQFDGNKSMTEFVMNNAEIRAMYYQCEDPTLDAQIEKALEELKKPDPFRGLHKKAKPLYLALSKKPDMTNAQLMKKLGVSERTVRNIKASLIDAGAMIAPTCTGEKPALNPDYFRPTSVEVIEDFEHIEGVANPSEGGGKNPAQEGRQKEGQNPAHAQENKGDEGAAISDGGGGKNRNQEGRQKGGKSPGHFGPLTYNTTPVENEIMTERQNEMVSGQPENEPEIFSNLTPSGEPPSNAQNQRSSSGLDGSAAGKVKYSAWAEYRDNHAMPGRSIFTLRAMAHRAGIKVPPLDLTEGGVLDTKRAAAVDPQIFKGNAQRTDDGTPEEQDIWWTYRHKHWAAGVRPVAKIRAMARAEGIYVPPFREPRKAWQADQKPAEPFTDPTLQSWGERHGFAFNAPQPRPEPTPEPVSEQPKPEPSAPSRNAWDRFRSEQWAAGVRPVQKIREMAREQGIHVPAFGGREPAINLAADFDEMRKERAAILEYDAGLPRVEAEKMALPSGLARSESERQQMLGELF
jgi:DNA-binding MarR family transcriptional regulator